MSCAKRAFGKSAARAGFWCTSIFPPRYAKLNAWTSVRPLSATLHVECTELLLDRRAGLPLSSLGQSLPSLAAGNVFGSGSGGCERGAIPQDPLEIPPPDAGFCRLGRRAPAGSVTLAACSFAGARTDRRKRAGAAARCKSPALLPRNVRKAPCPRVTWLGYGLRHSRTEYQQRDRRADAAILSCRRRRE